MLFIPIPFGKDKYNLKIKKEITKSMLFVY